MILVDGRPRRFAENRRRGRKDEVVDPVRDHRIQQILGLEHVVEVILGRLAHRFTDLDMGGEMQHAVEARGSEQLIQQVPLAQIPQYEAPALDRVTVAGGQIVQHRHLEPPLAEQLDHVGTDITRSADHEHAHGDFSSVFDTYRLINVAFPYRPPCDWDTWNHWITNRGTLWTGSSAGGSREKRHETSPARPLALGARTGSGPRTSTIGLATRTATNKRPCFKHCGRFAQASSAR